MWSITNSKNVKATLEFVIDHILDNAVYDIVKDVVNHKFQGGFHVFGLDSAGVGYVIDDNNKSLVSSTTIQKAEEAKQKIIGKQITVIDRMTQ